MGEVLDAAGALVDDRQVHEPCFCSDVNEDAPAGGMPDDVVQRQGRDAERGRRDLRGRSTGGLAASDGSLAVAAGRSG